LSKQASLLVLVGRSAKYVFQVSNNSIFYVISKKTLMIITCLFYSQCIYWWLFYVIRGVVSIFDPL